MPSILSRREMFRRTGLGFGALALNALMNRDSVIAATAASAMSPRAPHFAPRAKSVIFLFMVGGPSQVDTFDYKPELQKLNGKPVPKSIRAAVEAAAQVGAGLLKSTSAISPPASTQ